MTITLDTNEANTLIQLLDIATKAGGLQVANQALPLAIKISNKIAEEAVTPTEETEK